MAKQVMVLFKHFQICIWVHSILLVWQIITTTDQIIQFISLHDNMMSFFIPDP